MTSCILVKVKWSRYRPGVAQRVGRGIALLFHYPRHLKGWVFSSTPRPHFTPWKDPVPIVQEAWWAPGRSGRTEILVPTGIRSRTVQSVDSRYTDWATRPTMHPGGYYLSLKMMESPGWSETWVYILQTTRLRILETVTFIQVLIIQSHECLEQKNKECCHVKKVWNVFWTRCIWWYKVYVLYIYEIPLFRKPRGNHSACDSLSTVLRPHGWLGKLTL